MQGVCSSERDHGNALTIQQIGWLDELRTNMSNFFIAGSVSLRLTVEDTTRWRPVGRYLVIVSSALLPCRYSFRALPTPLRENVDYTRPLPSNRVASPGRYRTMAGVKARFARSQTMGLASSTGPSVIGWGSDSAMNEALLSAKMTRGRPHSADDRHRTRRGSNGGDPMTTNEVRFHMLARY